MPSAKELIAVTFSAEPGCYNAASTAYEWCRVQVLINETVTELLAPTATGEFTFDSTDAGNKTGGDCESQSMTRVLCVKMTQRKTSWFRSGCMNSMPPHLE
jgi:hypothetical protein